MDRREFLTLAPASILAASIPYTLSAAVEGEWKDFYTCQLLDSPVAVDEQMFDAIRAFKLRMELDGLKEISAVSYTVDYSPIEAKWMHTVLAKMR